MRVSIVDLLPQDAQIELRDISHLFYRYIQQTGGAPGIGTRAFVQAMNDVLDEEYGSVYVVYMEMPHGLPTE